MKSFYDTDGNGAGVASVAFCRSPLGGVSHHACVGPGEPGVWPDMPTLGFVHRGVAEIRLAERTAWADPTQVVLRGGGMPLRIHHHRCGGKVCMTTVSLSRLGLSELTQRFGVGKEALRRLFNDRLVPRVASIQRQLHLLIVDAMAGNGRSVTAVGERILDLFGEGISLASAPEARVDDSDRATRAVRRARLILASGLETAPGLDELAAAVDYSPFHLCRIFKARTGMSVTDYLHRLRLNEAVLELQLGAEDLSSLAYRLGYSSHSHFTDRFRRFYGMTPSTFRDQIRHTASGAEPLPMAILQGQWRGNGVRGPRSASSSLTPAMRGRLPSSCAYL